MQSAAEASEHLRAPHAGKGAEKGHVAAQPAAPGRAAMDGREATPEREQGREQDAACTTPPPMKPSGECPGAPLRKRNGWRSSRCSVEPALKVVRRTPFKGGVVRCTRWTDDRANSASGYSASSSDDDSGDFGYVKQYAGSSPGMPGAFEEMKA